MSIDLKSYLKAPDECPFCHSENITAEEADFSYINAWRSVRCNECKKNWQEEFTITHVRKYNDETGFIEED